MTLTAWEETLNEAIEALEQRWEEARDPEGASHVIPEIADGCVPVHNADRMAVAASRQVWERELEATLAPQDTDLMTLQRLTQVQPEIYIYEALYQALWSHYPKLDK